MNCCVWDLELPFIIMQVFKRSKELFNDLNRGASAEIFVEIRNTNHNYVISIMYMNALNNNSNLTMRLKYQHGSLSVEKKT